MPLQMICFINLYKENNIVTGNSKISYYFCKVHIIYCFYRNAQGNIKCHLLEAAHTPIIATVPPTLVAPHGYGGANGIGSLGKKYMYLKDIKLVHSIFIAYIQLIIN